MVMVPTQTTKNLICTSASSCETCSANTAIYFTTALSLSLKTLCSLLVANSMKHVIIHAHLNISHCSACVNVEGVTWFTGANQFRYIFIVTKMHITGFDCYCTIYVIALSHWLTWGSILRINPSIVPSQGIFNHQSRCIRGRVCVSDAPSGVN